MTIPNIFATMPAGNVNASELDDNFAACYNYTPSGTGAVPTTVAGKLAQTVSVIDFGADPTGSADSTTAIQNAINTGYPVIFPYAGIFKISSVISYTGKVIIFGNSSTIKGDCGTLLITNGTGSRIYDLQLLPITTPYTILRNPSVWTATAGNVVQSLQGYMPTSQDTDIWSSLSAAIQNQLLVRFYQRPSIYFKSSSATPNTNVVVSGITGYTCTIALEGYQNSTVKDCSVGGSTGEATIYFYNNVNFDLTGTGLGYTLAVGQGNSAQNNNTCYGSYCGISFGGNNMYTCIGNKSYLNGESGYKTQSQDNATFTTNAITCQHGTITGNQAYWNYYDGFDLGGGYGSFTGYNLAASTASGNSSFSNRATGFVAEQTTLMTISGNSSHSNGSDGIRVPGSYASVTGNTTANNMLFSQNGTNNQWGTAQAFEICIFGDGCTSFGNMMYIQQIPTVNGGTGYVHEGTIANSGIPTVGKEGTDVGNQLIGTVSANLVVYSTIPTSQVNLKTKNGLIDSGATVATTATSTWYNVMVSTTGVVVIRDNTYGGFALVMFDPIGSPQYYTIYNNIPNATFQESGGNLQISLSANGTRTLGVLGLLSQ